VSLLFEVEDLAVASPATVSRCGIVYNDYKDFGWILYVNSWLDGCSFKPYKDNVPKPEITILQKKPAHLTNVLFIDRTLFSKIFKYCT